MLQRPPRASDAFRTRHPDRCSSRTVDAVLAHFPACSHSPLWGKLEGAWILPRVLLNRTTGAGTEPIASEGLSVLFGFDRSPYRPFRRARGASTSSSPPPTSASTTTASGRPTIEESRPQRSYLLIAASETGRDRGPPSPAVIACQ